MALFIICYAKVKKIGLVSRDYNNKDSDFSVAYRKILQCLDLEGCDTVLFSLFSIIRRNSFDPTPPASLKKIKYIFFEEFKEAHAPDGKIKRDGLGFTVQYRKRAMWKRYRMCQQFGSITGERREKILEFVRDEMPGRRLFERG